MTASIFLTVLLVSVAPVPAPKPANERYGDAVVAILKGATRVEIVRLEPVVVELIDPLQPNFGGYAVRAVGKEQGEIAAVALGKVLLEEARLPLAKPVNFFTPWIGFRLWKGNEIVEVLVDPQTHNLQVIGYDVNGKILEQTLNVAHPATINALVKHAQKAFPDDRVLRQIKEIPEK
jgi:hypothetical protein